MKEIERDREPKTSPCFPAFGGDDGGKRSRFRGVYGIPRGGGGHGIAALAARAANEIKRLPLLRRLNAAVVVVFRIAHARAREEPPNA